MKGATEKDVDLLEEATGHVGKMMNCSLKNIMTVLIFPR